MNLEQHKNRDDMKVWLSTTGDPSEVGQLIDVAKNSSQRIAFQLGAFCGLRSEEISQVAPEDVRETDKGWIVRVPSGKGGKYRETPIPRDLATTIRTADEYRDEPSHHPIVTSTSSSAGVSTRSMRRWMQDAREQLVEDTGEQMWEHVTFHDLRRTWATSLRAADVDAMVVCDWGGWEDLQTFLDHYRGTSTPEAQRRERQKVDWLN
jgi:integrase